MKLRTLTWNIGGAKLLVKGADPSLMASYTIDGLSEIKSFLKVEYPDIITLQETHKDDSEDQIKEIADELGYKYFIHDSTSKSHIDTSKKLGHAIISRFPIVEHTTQLFKNPNISVTWEDGSTAQTFDKGFSTCEIDLGSQKISVTTLHLIPFKRFDIQLDSELGRQILNEVSSAITPALDKWIIQGDFNISDELLRNYLQPLFTENVEEVRLTDVTTPKNDRYDHVLFKNLTLINQRIDKSVKTDHYPVITDFEI